SFEVKITADEDLAASPRNTAYLAWNSLNDDDDDESRHEVSASDDVTILNPEVDIEKKIDTETEVDEDSIDVDPDQKFNYQLRVFQTAGGNTAAHNITVVDNVPAGVKISSISPEATSTTGNLDEGEGGTITWTLDGPLNVADAASDTEIVLSYSGEFI